jgi:CheY-like chemotaxis protein
MTHKVLWIEDGAYGDLPDLIGPVVVEGSYDLDIALDATEGVRKILRTEYDCVIVDIRLPPGEDRRWIDIYNHPRKNKDAARLGLLVLRSLLKPEKSGLKLEGIKEWVVASRFGVLTVENQGEVENDLKELDIGINVYRQKNRRPSVNTLLELIEAVRGQPRGRGRLHV